MSADPIQFTTVITSLGPLLVAASERGVCRVAFDEGRAELQTRYPERVLIKDGEDACRFITDVVQAVEEPARRHTIPLDLEGTPFQCRVWEALLTIPAGETRSYGELAASLGLGSGSGRAVGGANGANRIAVLVPCHRVVAADGTLGGYAYGLAIKHELLRREGASVATHSQQASLFA
ncbi:MAG: methylated-DNA--[protein]-cysteine S-methyltransferase [Alteraurantiacibacter sp.]